MGGRQSRPGSGYPPRPVGRRFNKQFQALCRAGAASHGLIDSHRGNRIAGGGVSTTESLARIEFVVSGRKPGNFKPSHIWAAGWAADSSSRRGARVGG